MKRTTTCGWIDVAAGFPVRITGDICRQCHEKGVQTPAAQLYRQGLVKMAITHVTVNGSASPLVQRVMGERGVPIRPRTLAPNHWPFPRWHSFWNSWEGTPYPVAVWAGIWQPTKKAVSDLIARWRGQPAKSCNRCGCWIPAKRVAMWLMDSVHPLPGNQRR